MAGEIISEIYKKKLKEPEITRLLTKSFDNGKSSNKDVDEIFIKMIRDYTNNFDEMCYLGKHINVSDISVLLYKILSLKNDRNYGLIASVILSCLRIELTIEQIDNALREAEEWNNTTDINAQDAIDYLIGLKGDKLYAPVPPWVNIKEGENLSLLRTISPGESFEILKDRNNEFISKAHDLFHDFQDNEVKGEGIGLSLDEAVHSVLASYSHGETNDRDKANRVFGPLNRFMDRDCVSNPYIKGPCRMLECICKEESMVNDDLKIDIKYSNWFIGKCQVCLCKIRDLSHAVRYPEKCGGWSGCYCGFECMREDLNYIDGNINLRIDNTLLCLKDHGIMDRTKV